MTTAIETLERHTVSLARDNPKLKKAAEAVFQDLKKANADNLEALLPIRDVDLGRVEMRWNELDYEDIEVECTYSYDDPITGEREEGLTSEERDSRLDLAKEARDAQKGPALERAYQELVDAIEDAEETRTELMWNYSWRPYGDDVDLELANSIPQLTGVTYKNDKYLTLSSIGQDNGPALMAYVALAHKCIDRDHTHHLTTDNGLEWTSHVIGRTWLMKVAKALGVEKQIKAKLASMAARRVAAAKKAEAVRKKREAIRLTMLSPKLWGAVVSAYMQDPYARWDNAALYDDPETLHEATAKADAWSEECRWLYGALGLTAAEAGARSELLEAAKKANASPADYVVHAVVGGVLPADHLLLCRTCGHTVSVTIRSSGHALFRSCESCGDTYEVTKKVSDA